jgi:glutamate 5-kinase
MAGGAGSSIGRGGMITKILAAKRAAGSGAGTVIAWGREPDVLLRLARRRGHRHRAACRDAQAGSAQAVDGRSSADARRRQ